MHIENRRPYLQADVLKVDKAFDYRQIIDEEDKTLHDLFKMFQEKYLRIQEENQIADSKALVDQAISTAVVASSKPPFVQIPILERTERRSRLNH